MIKRDQRSLAMGLKYVGLLIYWSSDRLAQANKVKSGGSGFTQESRGPEAKRAGIVGSAGKGSEWSWSFRVQVRVEQVIEALDRMGRHGWV